MLLSSNTFVWYTACVLPACHRSSASGRGSAPGSGPLARGKWGGWIAAAAACHHWQVSSDRPAVCGGDCAPGFGWSTVMAAACASSRLVSSRHTLRGLVEERWGAARAAVWRGGRIPPRSCRLRRRCRRRRAACCLMNAKGYSHWRNWPGGHLTGLWVMAPNSWWYRK